MLVNVPNINQDDDATPELFNSRFADIVNVLNGNIDASNIQDNSVTYSKMALDDADIPIAKLDLTPGTSSGATRDQGSIKIGTFLLQWGESDIANSGTTVTFTQAYATNPTVILTIKDPNSQQPWLTAKSTTTFTAKQPFVTTPLSVEWVAIGKAA